MMVSNLDIVTFCQHKVASLENFLDVCDYVPVVCGFSGKARFFLGCIEILVGLGWLLKNFIQASEHEAVKNDEEVALRLFSHGSVNFIRGVCVLSSYTLVKNVAVFGFDLCFPKLFIYSEEKHKKDRFIQYFVFYNSVQNVVNKLLDQIKNDVNMRKWIDKVRTFSIFPELPGAQVAKVAEGILIHVISEKNAHRVGEAVEEVVAEVRLNFMATLKAMMAF